MTASRSEQKRKNIVIASQCAHWRGNPPVLPEDDCPLVGAAIGRQRFPKSLPLGEGARGTRADEGNLPLPMGEVPPGRGRRGFYLPSQSLRDSSPRVGAKGLRIATPVCAISWYDCHWQSWIFQIRCAEHHWFAMTSYIDKHTKGPRFQKKRGLPFTFPVVLPGLLSGSPRRHIPAGFPRSCRRQAL